MKENRNEYDAKKYGLLLNSTHRYEAACKSYDKAVRIVDARKREGQISDVSSSHSLQIQAHLLTYAINTIEHTRNLETRNAFMNMTTLPGSAERRFLELNENDIHFMRAQELKKIASSSLTENESQEILDTVFSRRDDEAIFTGLTLLSTVLLHDEFDAIDSNDFKKNIDPSTRTALRAIRRRVGRYLKTKYTDASSTYMKTGEAITSFDLPQSEGSVLPVAIAMDIMISEPELLPSSYGILLSQGVFGMIDEATQYGLQSLATKNRSNLQNKLRERRDSNGGYPYKRIERTFSAVHTDNFTLEEVKKIEETSSNAFAQQFERATDYLCTKPVIPIIPPAPDFPGLSIAPSVHGEGKKAILDIIVSTANGLPSGEKVQAFAVQLGREGVKALSTFHRGNMQYVGNYFFGHVMEYIDSMRSKKNDHSPQTGREQTNQNIKEKRALREKIVYPNVKIPRPQLLDSIKNQRIRQAIEEEIQDRNAGRNGLRGLQGMVYLDTENQPTFLKYYYDTNGSATHALIVHVDKEKNGRGEAVACETEWVPVVLDLFNDGRKKIKLPTVNPYKP